MSIEPVAMNQNSHVFRATSYFCSSLLFLKEQRGAQAWNEIAKDAVELYMQSSLEVKPLSAQQVWFYLFDPPRKDSEWFVSLLSIFTQYPKVQDFFCQNLVYAMTDPPKEWWQSLKI